MSNVDYDDFYKNLLNSWNIGCDNENGWASLYYGVVSKAINDNNFKKCAEVGIGYGLHARQILDNTNLEVLYLIDPLQYYPNDGFVDDVMSFGGFELLVKNIKLHLSKYIDKYTWFRQSSTSITNEQIPDESLDLVFIDGDHRYDAVTNDLNFWLKKLRPGGWLLGDDYQSCCPETKQAVDDFSKSMNLDLELLYKTNGKFNYPIYKFVKAS